ncbi:chondroadherin-like protein [Bombina bombina]|uniref:chondroadherin-like protein n=1 Tax=Bombina bombina TaxID=8345 RepID=UPI00235AAB32|nr:chondroadherin-like protein [Bombina bombina]
MLQARNPVTRKIYHKIWFHRGILQENSARLDSTDPRISSSDQQPGLRLQKMRSLHILFWVFSVHGKWVTTEPSIPSCPVQCSCLSKQHHIICSSANLTSLPTPIANDTVELHLQHNSFPLIHNSFVRDVPELKGLYLSNCNISTIQTGAFQDVTGIQYLYLDRNQLTDLEMSTFSNLSRLSYLHLENNRIGFLRPGLFSPLKKLVALYLSHNFLSELPDGALKGLGQLRWLDLGFNLLSNISSQALSEVSSLRKLNLEMNNLTGVPSSLRSLSGLQMLRLSGNYIRKVSLGMFSRKQKSITELYLDNIGLEKVTSLAFIYLRMLDVLDLRNNSLVALPVSNLKTFTKLYLSGNPWNCDCSIIELHTRLQLKKIGDANEQAKCNNPKALEGQSLVTIKLQKLTCPAYKEDIITTQAPTAQKDRTSPKPSNHLVTATHQGSSKMYKTTRPSVLMRSTPGDLETAYNLWDPCLADQISNVLVNSIEEKYLEISWSQSGDYNQFEVRYTTGTNTNKLHIIGIPTNVRLYNLNPGSIYTICIVPQNVDIVKCQVPKARQCTTAQTSAIHEQSQPVQTPSQSNSSFVTTGVSITVVVLVVAAIFAAYVLRNRSIKFQRYYNEDASEGGGKQQSDPYKFDSIYENIDDDRHLYVMASNLWGMDNDKLDCSLAESVPMPSVPKYNTT